jgi:F0F1-type ATP synthase assembly protein I
MSNDPSEESRREQHAAWNAVSLIMAGVLFWGGLGWLVARWLDNQIFLAGGLLLGMGAALYLVWVRYGRA